MTEQEKIDFLKNHYTYHVANSWNGITSFAHNVKIHKVIPQEYRIKAYDVIETEDFYELYINPILCDFDRKYKNYNDEIRVGFNGRSGGYIVLSMRRGGTKLYSDIEEIIETYQEWGDIDVLYNLVKDFDSMVQDVIDTTVSFCKDYEVVEEEVEIVKYVKVKTLQSVA